MYSWSGEHPGRMTKAGFEVEKLVNSLLWLGPGSRANMCMQNAGGWYEKPETWGTLISPEGCFISDYLSTGLFTSQNHHPSVHIPNIYQYSGVHTHFSVRWCCLLWVSSILFQGRLCARLWDPGVGIRGGHHGSPWATVARRVERHPHGSPASLQEGKRYVLCATMFPIPGTQEVFPILFPVHYFHALPCLNLPIYFTWQIQCGNKYLCIKYTVLIWSESTSRSPWVLWKPHCCCSFN